MVDDTKKLTIEELRRILQFVSKGYKVPKVIIDTIRDVAKKEVEDKKRVVILKRDPDIESGRMQAVYVKIIDGNTIEIFPPSVKGFGADFDGDSSYSFISTYDKLNNNLLEPRRLHISEFDKIYNCKIKDEKYKDDKHIKNYDVQDEVWIYSIDQQTGDIKKKKIINWSIHENLEMYKIERKKRNSIISDVKDLWVSSDHSMVVYNKENGLLERLSPKDILENKKQYFLIRYKLENISKDVNMFTNTFNYVINEDNNLTYVTKELLHKQENDEIEFIPCDCLDITLDPNLTIGYDLTVEDYKTFITDQGLFLYDTMAVYVPISKEAQEEAKNKLMRTTGTNSINESLFEISKEALTGIYTLTYEEDTKTPVVNLDDYKKIYNFDISKRVNVYFKGKRRETTSGKIIFNTALPDNYPFVNYTVGKKELNKILSEIIGIDKSLFVDTLNKLIRMAFFYATVYPQTLSLDLLLISDDLKKLKRELEEETDVAKQSTIIDKMEDALLEHLKNNAQDLYLQVKSGAAKGTGQIRQIMVAKGLITDSKGNIITVTKAMNDGYTPNEYFDAAAGSRKGTMDRALNTAHGGYSYRKAIFAVGDVQASLDIANCETKRTLNIKLTKDLMDRMTGRFHINENGKLELLTDKYIGKSINLRSPIFCKSKKICRTCYGKLLEQLKSSNVGILASQNVCSLSEKIMKCSVGLINLEDSVQYYTMDDIWELL